MSNSSDEQGCSIGVYYQGEWIGENVRWSIDSDHTGCLQIFE